MTDDTDEEKIERLRASFKDKLAERGVDTDALEADDHPDEDVEIAAKREAFHKTLEANGYDTDTLEDPDRDVDEDAKLERLQRQKREWMEDRGVETDTLDGDEAADDTLTVTVEVGDDSATLEELGYERVSGELMKAVANGDVSL